MDMLLNDDGTLLNDACITSILLHFYTDFDIFIFTEALN